MAEKNSIFLNDAEAVQAVRTDLRQYEPQVLLCCAILRVISQGRIVARKEIGKKGAWVGVPGIPNMRWFDGPELTEYVCEAVADPDPDVIPELCSMVFQARAKRCVHPITGEVGIRVETGMEGFVCRQCGHCCKSLDYHWEVTSRDMALWREKGRNDILEWVGMVQRGDGEQAYRIWTVPGTDRLAETCPFLQKVPSEERRLCSIHDVKPWICRNYPVSRKHAHMTGCMGFSKKQAHRG